MSSTTTRKRIITYSRQKKRTFNVEEPTTKRRRVDSTSEANRSDTLLDTECLLPSTSSPATENLPEIVTSKPKNSVQPPSDVILNPTPQPSPMREQLSLFPQQRKPLFSLLRRKSEPARTGKDLLSQRSSAQPSSKAASKQKRLTQMQLDLGGDKQKKCKICGMEYVPSNEEDAAVHKKFHAKSVGGVDIAKSLTGKLKENQVWEGGDGSFIAVVGRNDTVGLRNKAIEVLDVVNSDLAAVAIPDGTLWSQTAFAETDSEAPTGGKRAKSSGSASSDRFKVYLYLRGHKCIGACLAERITEAFTVVDECEAAKGVGKPLLDLQSSSISVSSTTEAAILGISRIWTSNLHRKSGIATRLMDSARSDFLYGMVVPKEQMAFSQPTESGGRLARKWFNKSSGWHVYAD
ncbi:sister chromatid cohesion acetyltransferas-like protein Eco1 [Delitschia confertaspora ATCC 74209]|uniref:Sister chromatid cohesion acetyltransferas-like protein Eco1 n=1 Tax=Delitschia confertaspora ATCC 74209 TaxID=1513339 RepID=A0A9P4JQ98_9PLEO|nr:sister chromatid cohesion acetyltransferas-like protein Eco1 [Delitschia confertaspora ATCC 74209]